MVKKIFLLCLLILLNVPGLAVAKEKGLPEAERIKVAVEIKDSSRYVELNTAQTLEIFLSNKLAEKNLVNVVGTKIFPEPKEKSDGGLILDEDITAEQSQPAENIGEILIFDAVELPRTDALTKNFDAKIYSISRF